MWVALCMVAGIGLGKLLPGAIAGLRGIEFGKGSQINAPIAVLIWLMITPMMMKVDFSSVRNVGKRPAGLLVTLFINWVVKPFSMALLAWAFFRFIFAPFITRRSRINTLQAASSSAPRFATQVITPEWTGAGTGKQIHDCLSLCTADKHALRRLRLL